MKNEANLRFLQIASEAFATILIFLYMTHRCVICVTEEIKYYSACKKKTTMSDKLRKSCKNIPPKNKTA